MVKKLLFSFVLILMAAAWTTSEGRWVVGERKNASQIKAGDTVVMHMATRTEWADYYLKLADDEHPDLDLMISSGMGLGADAVVTFEEGPNDIRTDAPTLYMKMVGNGKYIAAKYYNWYDKGMELTESIDNAAPWQVLNCGEQIPWYDPENDRTQWNTTENSNWDSNSVGFSVSPSATTWAYLSYWDYGSARPRAITWSYSSGNHWNVYAVTYEEDLREDLEKLIDSYTASSEYQGGNGPGYYSQDKVDAFDELLASALTTCYDASATDETLQAAYDNLKTAHDEMMASLIPMQDGYYYILNDGENISNNGVTEKAMYINENTGAPWYKPFDENDISFVFNVKQREDGFWDIKSLKTDLYLGYATAFCGTFVSTSDNAYYANLTSWPGTGNWYIQTHNGARYWAMTAHGDPGESDEKTDYVWAYNGREVRDRAHETWGWRFVPLTDEQMDRFEDVKKQVDRTAELSELVKEASDLYGKLFTYTVDEDGLIKVVNGGAYEEPTDESQIRFGTARGDGQSYIYMAGKYEYLIDAYDSTYIKCDDYIDIDISKTPVQTITFKWETRCASMTLGTANQHKWGVEERPNEVEIYASNDTVGGNWVKVGGNTFGTVTEEERLNPFPPVVYSLDMGEPYKYVRYVVKSNASGGSRCTFASFQVYGSTVDKTASQYYATEGMAAKADAMNALQAEMRDIVAANTATDDNIADMKAAISAVRELYADTTELAALIAESEILLDGVQVGDGMGQLSDENLKTALEQAISDARTNAFTSPISVEAVKTAVAAVSAAKTAFLAGLKSIEVGKWYFITNLDTERMGDAGTEDAYCYGNAIYLNNKRPGSSVTKWGLFDEESMQLNADGNPKAMWRFVPVEGTEYYAIQNLYNGYYLGDFAGANINLPISELPVPYKVAYAGNAKFTLTPMTSANKEGLGLWPEGFENDVVCHTQDAASAWTFVEVVPEEQEAISISDFPMNYIDVMALPYDICDIADYNDDVHTYAVRKISQEMDDEETVTTIELYEKSKFHAGEPCIIVLGSLDPNVEFEDFDLIIPFPTEMLDHSATFVSNGIVGALHDQKCAQGTAICVDGKQFTAVTSTDSGFGAQTGVFDLSTYKGEVADQETALTLTIRGMAELKDTNTADVDGDGKVNTADVVAVYDFIISGEESGITQTAADVDGNGQVNTADVVAIYTAIVGDAAAGSPIFRAQMQQLLNNK